MLPVGKEAWNFVRACEAILAILDHEGLLANDREIIEYSANELLNKLKRP